MGFFTPNAIDNPKGFKDTLAELVKENSLAVTLNTIADICRDNSSDPALEPKAQRAWALSEDRVRRAYYDQIRNPGY